MKSTYLLEDLIGACGKNTKKVNVFDGAVQSAQKDFKFKTKYHIVQFIGRGGLERATFLNTKEWENNPHPNNPIMVDAYSFYSGDAYGYMAFFRNTNDQWIIKSFKKNREPDTRNFILRDQLKNHYH